MAESDMEGLFEKKKSDPTLRDLLAPLFRRKRVLALTFFGIMLGTVVAAFVLNSMHKGTMEILVNEQRVDPTVTSQSTQGQAAPPAVSDYDIGSEVELLKSEDLLRQVVLANRLQDIERRSITSRLHPGANDAWFIARATDKLHSKLEVAPVSKSNLIEVDYKSIDPQMAYNVLETLGRLYLAKHNAVHRPQGAYGFFASETDRYQKALADSEARLADFTKATGITAPDVQRTEMAQQVVNSVAALEAAQETVAADEKRIEDEKQRMKMTPERSLAQESTDSAQSLMQQLQADLLAEEIKKTQLLMKYEPSYPLAQEAEQEIAQTQAAILNASKQQYVNRTTDRDATYELMREDVARTQADLAFHKATTGALQSSLRDLRMQMLKLDQDTMKQADLTREVSANQANYLLYLSKREQERTSDAMETFEIRFSSNASEVRFCSLFER